MSQSAADETGQSGAKKKIQDAIDQMHVQQTEYFDVRNRVAASGENPDENGQVTQALLDFHTAVMFAFAKLRADIQDELADDYWATDEFDVLARGGPATNGDAPTGGLQLLDEWWDISRSETHTEYNRHTGHEQHTEHTVSPPPAVVLGRVADILAEAAAQLGYLAEPKKRTPRTKITEEDIQNVRQWHKQQQN